METQNKDICVCTLALGKRYREMVVELGKELEKYSPGISLVVFTDEPQEFSDRNIIPFKHRQQGILHCYNDKRFAMKQALSLFRVAIYIDADTRLVGSIPENIDWKPGITGQKENLLQHMTQYRPQNVPDMKKLAAKLQMSEEVLENANWISDSLYIIVRDGGKELEFLEQWGQIARYMELKKMYSGQGNLMGLAATKVGWEVNSEGWQEVNQVREHWDASRSRPKPTVLQTVKRKLGYHYRLNRERIKALKEFDFYYR